MDIRGSREAGKLTAPISVFSLETGKWKRVGKGGYPCYSPTGHVLYKGPEHLINMALPFDVESLEPTGDAVRVGILEGVNDFTFSSDGTLVYFQPTLGSSLVWVDRQGGVELLAETQKNAFSPRLSPDGTRLLMVRLRSLSLDQLAASERLIS